MNDILLLCIDKLGLNHDVTIAVSKKVDEEILIKQKLKLMKEKGYLTIMEDELRDPSEYQKVFEKAYEKSMSAIKGENYFE